MWESSSRSCAWRRDCSCREAPDLLIPYMRASVMLSSMHCTMKLSIRGSTGLEQN